MLSFRCICRLSTGGFNKSSFSSLCHSSRSSNAIKRFISTTYTIKSMTKGQGEEKLKAKLQQNFPSASSILVEDISGGCGSMYQISVEAMEFTGLSIVKQHQLINQALKDDIKEMHGLRISTSVPKKKE